MTPPTGEQYTISAGGYTAVVTQGGAALRSLTHHGRELVSGFGADEIPRRCRGQHLMPWPNRIRGGRYMWDGTTQQLALTEPALGNAIHGLTRWQPWLCVQHMSDTVVMAARIFAQAGYPWTLDLTITFHVDYEGLTVTQAARNVGRGEAPYAHGSHPYLKLPTGKVDDWVLWLQGARTRLLTDEHKIPVGQEAVHDTEFDFTQPRQISGLRIDHCFTDIGFSTDVFPEGRAFVTVWAADGQDSDPVSLWYDSKHEWLMVYTDDGEGAGREGIAIEPMTAPPDAFNSGEGVVRLKPGDEFSASWGIYDGYPINARSTIAAHLHG